MMNSQEDLKDKLEGYCKFIRQMESDADDNSRIVVSHDGSNCLMHILVQIYLTRQLKVMPYKLG